jgi:hypothetical protein
VPSDPVRINRRELPENVAGARAAQREADSGNEAALASRVEAHLRISQAILDTLRDQHRRLVEETDFDPLQKTRPSAAWLLAGRVISLSYAIVVGLRSGLTTEVGPLARTLHEASAALRIMLDAEESALHRKWLRDGYFSPSDLEQAQRRMEDRAAVEMLRSGVAPPGRTDKLDHQLYGQWSKIAHNRRTGILENYRADLREFAYGPHPDPLRRALWVGYGTQIVSEVTVTVGAVLTKMLGPETWVNRVEPAISALGRLQRDQPLDPTALGFPEPADA